MAIASVSTITSASPESWQRAAELGFERARQTLRGITGVKLIEEKARVEDGAIVEFLVTLQIVFLLEEDAKSGDSLVDAAGASDAAGALDAAGSDSSGPRGRGD